MCSFMCPFFFFECSPIYVVWMFGVVMTDLLDESFCKDVTTPNTFEFLGKLEYLGSEWCEKEKMRIRFVR